MDRTVARCVALGVFVLALGEATIAGRGLWTVPTLGTASLGLIGFPREIDGANFGHWYRGQRVYVHTPPVLIAAMGWLGLAFTVGYPAWINDLFGVP